MSAAQYGTRILEDALEAKEPIVLKQVKEDTAYYTVSWSLLRKADKYDIIRAVPAMGGLVELYFMDEYGKLNLFCVTRTWYGGLRAAIRAMTDPELEKDTVRRQILLDHPKEIYYRYTLTESLKDMNDILFFFMRTLSPDNDTIKDSGRYAHIYLNEIDPQKLTTI